MKYPMVVGILFSALVSNANAFTLDLDFPQGKPTAMDFSFAVSSGNCNTIPYQCFYTRSSYTGIKEPQITKFMRDMNSTFDSITPALDSSHNPTNFAEIKLAGQNNVCHINLLNKSKIHVKINKDGTCSESVG